MGASNEGVKRRRQTTTSYRDVYGPRLSQRRRSTPFLPRRSSTVFRDAVRSPIRRRLGVQPIDQLEHEHRPTLERVEHVFLLAAGGVDQAKLSEGFLGGATGMEQEPAEVGYGAAAAGLGDVRDHRERRPDQLIATGERAGAAEGLRQLSALFGHSFGDLSHEQTTGIRAEHHALMMASGERGYVIIPTPSLHAFLQRYSSTLLLDGSLRRREWAPLGEDRGTRTGAGTDISPTSLHSGNRSKTGAESDICARRVDNEPLTGPSVSR